MKKLLTALLALALVLTCTCGFSAQAAAATSGTCGDNLTWTLDEAGTLTVSGAGPMEEYASVTATPWYNDRSNIKAVVIGNDVTTVSAVAFASCANLTSVTIGERVTAIGEYAFSFCDSLTILTLPDSINTIGYEAFWGCSSLIYNVYDNGKYLGNSANPYVALMGTTGAAITGCAIHSRTKIISSAAFANCRGLTSVTIPSGVKVIGDDAFASCPNLTGIYVSEKNTAYSSDARGVLFNKDKTILVQAPGGIVGGYTVPGSVTTIGYSAFYDCAKLTTVTVPDSVATIGSYAFYNCDSLRAVTLGTGVMTIHNSAFRFSDSLENVYYAGTSAQWKVITIGTNNTSLINAMIHYVHTHEYSGTATVVAPTCIAVGYTDRTCEFCGFVEKTDIVPALGHDKTSHEAKAATCTEIGWDAYVTCSRCDYTTYQEIAALGHDEVTHEAKAATCTEIGWNAYVTCSRCDYTTYQELPALGHSMVELPAVAPTCTKPGLTAGSHCERCQLVETAQTEISATGHNFAEGVCTVCGAPENVSGDLDGNGNVNEDDAIYLLQHVMMPDLFAVPQPVDFNGDGKVNEDDAIYLLQHVMMPDLFPLQ